MLVLLISQEVFQQMEESKIPLDNFYQWIYAICVVNFDVDLGQTLEYVYPQHVQLTDAERGSIIYLAFPDSYSSTMDNAQHHFRFKCTSANHLLLRYFPLFFKNYSPTFLVGGFSPALFSLSPCMTIALVTPISNRKRT